MLANSYQKSTRIIDPPSVERDNGRRAPRRTGDALSLTLILVVCAAAGLIVAATAIRPEIDLIAARAVLETTPEGARAALAAMRPFVRIAPFVLCVGVVLALVLRMRSGRIASRAGRVAILFVVGAFALGPGLMVNVGLKEHSHRPRPIQTAEVKGMGDPFRPFYAFDGACVRNCSFSSGETASAFWTTGPALLAPAPLRLLSVAAALGFGAATAGMRMALGAHYLSDVAFSALLILLLTLAARHWLSENTRS